MTMFHDVHLELLVDAYSLPQAEHRSLYSLSWQHLQS